MNASTTTTTNNNNNYKITNREINLTKIIGVFCPIKLIKEKIILFH